MSTKRTKLVIPIIFLASVACIFTALVVIAGGAFFFGAKQQGSDQDRILSLYLTTPVYSRISMETNGYKESIKDVKVDGNWAIVESVVTDTKTGEPVTGIVEVFHRKSGVWYSSLDNPKLRASWIDQVPESLIPLESKKYLR